MSMSEPAGANSLVRLIYRSRGAVPGSVLPTAVGAILDRAWTHNPGHGITGVLLFDGAFFLQVIEGTLASVEDLYEAIARDLRHEAIELIDFLPTETRDYADFSMAYLEVSENRFPALQHVMSRAVQGSVQPLRRLITEALAAT
jgi:hypothetical protein